MAKKSSSPLPRKRGPLAECGRCGKRGMSYWKLVVSAVYMREVRICRYCAFTEARDVAREGAG